MTRRDEQVPSRDLRFGISRSTESSWRTVVKRIVPSQLHSRGRHLHRYLRQKLGNPLGQSRPVFLVGCGRSGTSMLVSHLSRSWEVDLYNEDHPEAFENWRLRDLSTIRALIDHSSARIVLFKPILDTHLAGELLHRFLDARLVFAFRHYDDVINSSKKRFGPENWQARVAKWMQHNFDEFAALPPPIEARQRVQKSWRADLSAESAIALYWLFYNGLYYDLGLQSDSRVKLVQYETAVTDPQREMKLLCQFLSIQYHPKMVEGVFSSSVNRDVEPQLDTSIRWECESLWKRLCHDAKGQTTQIAP